jgi:hypothetical protein
MSIREYGRGVQKMINHLMTIENKEERQAAAEAVVDVMAILNPQNKAIEDYRHKLWDHMIMMSDYKLEVESPFEMPTAAVKEARPEPLPYPKHKLKFKHLGKKFEELLNMAIAENDEEKKKGYIHTLALFMRLAYNGWHDEKVHDDSIADELKQLSKGQLIFEPGRFSDFVDGGDSAVIFHKSFSENNNKVTFKKKNQNNKHKRSGSTNANAGGNNQNSKYKKYRR